MGSRTAALGQGPQQDYGVGRDTVLHALRTLRDDGLIFTVPKRGSYVSQPR